ncbi:TetR/AcrR family transcriptional regulator C-terminal domain-containing protein [Microbacterium sp. MM2322]|jgi:AcrR family transcriptional regulator|uniref:TetR/AcrR family transcriptional regulator C-terminal domain-containing protein n=1 Tax=Microbacterium sp. MM2322 TaxID=3157631 RepID=UPI0032D5A8D7
MTGTSRRGRGTRAGLDRDRILTAARDLDPATLTMQQVADALGVDRKALNHHVTDRESLLEMLAVDAFRRRFASSESDLGTTWQDACRGYARAVTSSLMDIGTWVGHLPFATPDDLAIVEPAEEVASRLREAGFDLETTSRGMHLLMSICQGFAREVVASGYSAQDPQVAHLRDALGSSAGGYPVLRELVDAAFDNHGEAQLRFNVDAFIAGMERLL